MRGGNEFYLTREERNELIGGGPKSKLHALRRLHGENVQGIIQHMLKSFAEIDTSKHSRLLSRIIRLQRGKEVNY